MSNLPLMVPPTVSVVPEIVQEVAELVPNAVTVVPRAAGLAIGIPVVNVPVVIVVTSKVEPLILPVKYAILKGVHGPVPSWYSKPIALHPLPILLIDAVTVAPVHKVVDSAGLGDNVGACGSATTLY